MRFAVDCNVYCFPVFKGARASIYFFVTVKKQVPTVMNVAVQAGCLQLPPQLGLWLHLRRRCVFFAEEIT